MKKQHLSFLALAGPLSSTKNMKEDEGPQKVQSD
jgi:hypothetical protein